MDKTTLGDRMKTYEKAYDTYMPSRLPVIIRLDGKKFSKYTKKLKAKKPFDEGFASSMANTMRAIASNIEGCLFGYCQSDEITLVIRNDQSFESDAWLGNRIQKIVSITASMTSVEFNKQIRRFYADAPDAYFDCRVFIVPSVVEAENCVLWRQNDCTKNSVSSACYYEVAKSKGKKTARKMMNKLNQKQQQELLFKETGINWNDYPIRYKRGYACYREVREVEIDGNKCMRSHWTIDGEMPRLTQDKEYLRNILAFEHDDEE